MSKHFDIYIVGVGGQGVLTISNLITQACVAKDLGVNYYPTKGMTQRGGFVKAQVRCGREPGTYSPSIAPAGADLVISMELAETLKAIPYAKKGADFVVFGDRWLPAGVQMGKDSYPTVEEVIGEIKKAGGNVIYLNPEDKPEKMRANLYILGSVMAHTELSELISLEFLQELIANKWPKVAEGNLATVKAGAEAKITD
ncbi:MAG: 2-oxoacid:acceptor oxidoreductase family protein [Eubacterium sp.]|nr:2-oxoacid:acceptor oxidoreductase family protein [Candidatus Colimonas fimequi]